MRQIYKYELHRVTDLFLTEPKFLHVGVQGGIARIWVEVEISRGPAKKYTLHVIPTGDIPPPDGTYIGTFFSDPDGTYVWHVFYTESNS